MHLCMCKCVHVCLSCVYVCLFVFVHLCLICLCVYLFFVFLQHCVLYVHEVIVLINLDKFLYYAPI